MSIEVTMRHSDVRIESLKEYAQKRMEKLQAGERHRRGGGARGAPAPQDAREGAQGQRSRCARRLAAQLA